MLTSAPGSLVKELKMVNFALKTTSYIFQILSKKIDVDYTSFKIIILY
jgi:hypothetical protein